MTKKSNFFNEIGVYQQIIYLLCRTKKNRNYEYVLVDTWKNSKRCLVL